MFSLAKRIRINSVAWLPNLWKGSTNGQESLLLVHSIQSHVSPQCWATEEVDMRRSWVCLQPEALRMLRYLKWQTISQSAAESRVDISCVIDVAKWLIFLDPNSYMVIVAVLYPFPGPYLSAHSLRLKSLWVTLKECWCLMVRDMKTMTDPLGLCHLMLVGN